MRTSQGISNKSKMSGLCSARPASLYRLTISTILVVLGLGVLTACRPVSQPLSFGDTGTLHTPDSNPSNFPVPASLPSPSSIPESHASSSPVPVNPPGTSTPGSYASNIPVPTGTPGPGGGYIPLLQYRLEGGIAGFCDSLVVYANGQFAYEDECRRKQLNGKVKPEDMLVLDSLANKVHTFSKEVKGMPGEADAMSSSIILHGRSSSLQSLTPAEEKDLVNVIQHIINTIKPQLS